MLSSKFIYITISGIYGRYQLLHRIASPCPMLSKQLLNARLANREVNGQPEAVTPSMKRRRMVCTSSFVSRSSSRRELGSLADCTLTRWHDASACEDVSRECVRCRSSQMSERFEYSVSRSTLVDGRF